MENAVKLIIRIKKPDYSHGFKIGLFIVAIFTSFFLGVLIGGYKALIKNLPDIKELKDLQLNRITNVLADDGEEVIGTYAREKRIEVQYKDIPQNLINAIIATEDPRFYSHRGIDFLGILRAVRENLKLRGRSGRLHGGSTISQQLVREFLLHKGQTIRRKIKEALLALQIEKTYTKVEILTLYCNKFDLGHGVHGIEAASQLYFGKSVHDLTLEESALIAGIFRGPYLYSPYNRPELMMRRRNHVLNRMIEEGYLSQEEGKVAKETPLDVLPLRRGESDFAGYFREEVRRYLEKEYGYDALYKDGLKVYTTLDTRLQAYAEEALRRQLHVLDKRQGWRDDKENLLENETVTDEELENIWLNNWNKPSLDTPYENAVVLEVLPSKAQFKVKNYSGELGNKDINWTKTRDLTRLIKRGDVIKIKVNKIDEDKKTILASLDQEPLLEGAFLAIEPQTGQIKAMVGGYSFKRSQFNRATQALRQPGSAIKPFIYTAAIRNNFTPATIIIDEPTEFEDKWAKEPWSPPNYDQKYKGAVTLRIGLEESRNIVTAKILESISPQAGVDSCQDFGLTTTLYPFLSLSLGTFEVYMKEIVSAYTVFPNKGVRVEPYFIRRIEDREGNILEESKIETDDVIPPEIAYIMTSLMQGVIIRGSAWPARPLTGFKELAGKTGTTDDFTDAWFIGFSPSLCAGVWIGHETKLDSIGEHQSGMVAALPVWQEFFQRIIDEEKARAEEEGIEYEKETFDIPSNVTFIEIDRKTGLLLSPWCLFPLKEVFIPGTEPVRSCTPADHMMILDYYSVKEDK
ncbi:MAG: PBP1A family penicillin-binding protein [Candidatus Aminicenantes bacterium]|nr:PBP1A family penicillin-binding protein [Candidatus Aminicenantes bacterium]